MTHLNLKSLLLGLLIAVALSMTIQPRTASALVWTGDADSSHGSGIGIFKNSHPQTSLNNIMTKVDADVQKLCDADGSYATYKKFLDVGMPLFYIFFSPVSCYTKQAEDQIAACNKSKKIVSGYVSEQARFKWWDGIFTALSNASENVTNAVFDQVASGCIKLLAAGLAIWLALTTLPMVASLKEQNPTDYLMKIGTILFKAMVAVFLLQHRDWFFEYLVGPIISIAAGFVGIDAGDGVGVKAVTTPLRAMMEAMHLGIAEIMGVGSALSHCLGWGIGAFMFSFGININILWVIQFRIGLDLPLFPVPNWGVLFGGCTMWACGIIMGIVFPLRVFDAIFRLGIILALSPLYIVSWVFPATKDFATKGLSSVLHIAFLFITLYIGMFLSINLLFAASGIDQNVLNGGTKEVAIAIMMPFISTGSAIKTIFILLITTVFCVKMLMKTDEIANHFAGVNFSSNAASGVAGMVASAAKSSVIDPAVGLAGKGVKALGGKAKDAIGEAHDKHTEAKLQKVGQRYTAATKESDGNGKLTNRQTRRDEKYLAKHGVVDANAERTMRRRDADLARAEQVKNDPKATEEEKKNAQALADQWTKRENGKLVNPVARRDEEMLVKAGLLNEKGEKPVAKTEKPAPNEESKS